MSHTEKNPPLIHDKDGYAEAADYANLKTQVDLLLEELETTSCLAEQ